MEDKILFGKSCEIVYTNTGTILKLGVKKPSANVIFWDKLAEHFAGINSARVCLSGGIDSQFSLQAAKKLGIDISAVTYAGIWQGTVVNAPDVVASQRYCQHYSIPLEIIDIDLYEFLNSNELIEYGETYKVSSPQIAAHLKLFNQNSGNITIGESINALNAVLYHHNGNLLSKAKTVCLPWVIPQNNFVDAKINEMNENNLIVVCAAGNDGADINTYSPAGVVNAITVGAYDRNYNVSSFTNAPWGGAATTGFVNYGAELDIFALGVDVDVASISDPSNYETVSGTSLSTGVVAGISTHYTSRYPTKTAKEIKDIILQEGHFLGSSKLVFDSSDANVNYNLVNKSIITTDNTDTAQVATTPSGRLLNVQVGASATANIGLNPDATEVETLDFAPTPPFISFDASTGIVSVTATGLDPTVQVPGVYVFAIKGKINTNIVVEEYSVGLYTTSEDELTSSSQYYYDADANEYDLVVSYQVSPNLYGGGGPKP